MTFIRHCSLTVFVGCFVAFLNFATVPVTAVCADRPFEISIVDDQTGRGIPLVEARTVNQIAYVTDNAGRIAFDEPGLLGRRVFFQLRSHGYDIPKDAFGGVGISLQTTPGGKAEVKLKRRNLAERIYRITGQGLYSDSIRLGYKTPLEQPTINGLVLGQDSTMAIPYRGRIRWFWGDTQRAAHPLGHFQTAGATSLLPADGGLAANVGVNLTYFTNAEGFSRPMAPLREAGMVWIDGLLIVPNDSGDEVLIAHFSRRKALETQLEHGLLQYDDEHDVFRRIKTFDESNTWRHPRGQATKHDGYWYFVHPFATTRVPASLKDVTDPSRYEALVGATSSGTNITARWDRIGPPLEQKSEASKKSAVGGSVALLQLHDLQGKAVLAHAGSIRWNEHRQRWVLITVQHFGSSFLGEVWYAEAPTITGPWDAAVKIVTHDKYSFYNPVQHAFFDEAQGRYIYFEGTYTHTFSGNDHPTMRYDYNQILYRLDVDAAVTALGSVQR